MVRLIQRGIKMLKVKTTIKKHKGIWSIWFDHPFRANGLPCFIGGYLSRYAAMYAAIDISAAIGRVPEFTS